MTDHLKGILITALGVLILTPDALFTRLISADSWTLTFWRGLLSGLGMTIFLGLFYRRQFIPRLRAMGWPGIWVGLIFAIGTIGFILAITNTTVANALVLVNTAPVFTALIAWLFLGERVLRRTWLVIGLVLSGIVYVALAGGPAGGNLAGNLAALLTAIAMAGSLSITRHYKERDMVPAMALAGFLTALLALPLATPAQINGQDMLLLAILGLFILPAAFGLMYIGPRYIPAPEVSLLSLLEAVLGPLWVWLALGEQPGATTLIGGSFIVATLAGNAIIGMREAVPTAVTPEGP